MMSSRPYCASSALSSGTSVRWPAASEETPTMWTSFSIAWRAASPGVAKSGPISTSKPRSAKAEAITFWPRSWPSWPILATRMRGRRPSLSSNASTRRRTALDAVGHLPDLPLVDARDRRGSRPGGGPRPVSSASLKSRRPSPWRAPPRRRGRAGCRRPTRRRARARRAPRRPRAWSRSAFSRRSFSIWRARTARCRP